VKDGKLKLNDIKINLTLGDVEVHIIKSQNPALGKSAIQLNDDNRQFQVG